MSDFGTDAFLVLFGFIVMISFDKPVLKRSCVLLRAQVRRKWKIKKKKGYEELDFSL
mgnify:CR=1 FL=1